MRITTFTDFALRVLMRLAAEPEALFRIEEMATDWAISRNHLAKVVQKLAKSGYVITQRGAGGGFRLAVDPEKHTLGAVVRLLEQDVALVECFRGDGGQCALTPRCRLKSRFAVAKEAFYAELDKTTLAQCAYHPLEDLV